MTMKLKALGAMAASFIAASFLLASAQAEQLQYYVWTDDNGQVHATDTPPDNRDYETRTIVFDPGTEPGGASGDASRQSSAADADPDSAGGDAASSQPGQSGRNASATVSADERDSGLERALTAERLRRGEASQAPDPAGHTSPPGGNGLDEVPRIPGVPNLPGLQGP